MFIDRNVSIVGIQIPFGVQLALAYFCVMSVVVLTGAWAYILLLYDL